MRRSSTATALPVPLAAGAERRDWQTLKTLFPYIWTYRFRVLFALACLVSAKLANVSVPLIFKQMIDSLSAQTAMLLLPVALIAAYGALRFSTSMFTD
jgi:ATP-binding cassette, subfamily B, heavy metal transporter